MHPRDDDRRERHLASDVERMEAACASLRGDAQLYRHVVARLKALFDVLKSLGESEQAPVAIGFEAAVASLLRALQVQNRNAFPLQWIATSQRSVAQAYQVHSRIDSLYKTLNINEAAQLADWRGELHGQRLEQERWLEERLELSTDAMIFSDVPSETKRREALATLRNQLKVWPTSGSVDDRVTTSTELKMSRKLADLMLQTADRVHSYSETHKEVYAWYVPEEDVEVSKSPFKENSFGGLHEGTWFDHRTGEQRKVVVKQLYVELVNSLNDSITFARELTTWSQLNHKHILKLLGGNHLSWRKFFITELASEGSFVDYFERNEHNRKLLWRLFVQAAEGLRFLHSNGMEHRRLKCSNILLTRPEGGTDEDLVAKLSNFSVVIKRTDSTAESIRDDSLDVRFVAPERFTETNETIDFRRADMYSFGLCVIDAATGEPPFGLMDNDEIVISKLIAEPMERPDEGFTDDEWALVSSMSDNDPSKRPTLEQVIERMRELDEVRRHS